ncbi:MAG: ABC transporter ATP-binding protein [Candidatus Sifarchaeia archaeon]|jgi:energy-coupling factor transport system ATP-binding protein
MNPLINVENFSYWYSNTEKPALNDINLKINKGERLLIVGPSGCGKSTLILCISGLIPHSNSEGKIKGSVTVGSENLHRTPPYHLKNKVGVVLQNPSAQLFSLKVKDEVAFGPQNLGLPPDEIQERVYFALEAVEMEKFAEKSLTELSMGQQQRVCIASMLAFRPAIMVFDEPTSNIDLKTGRKILPLIDQISENQNITVIIAEHRTKEVSKITDRVIVLNRGEIVADDPQILTDTKFCNTYGIQPLNTTIYPSLQSNITNGSKIVQVENLSFSYNNHSVLTDLSFSIFERESLGIMGENGSGKTTLALILAGVLQPKQGSIVIDGKPIGKYKRKQAIRKIGVLFQNPDDNILTTKVSNEILYAPWIQRLSEDEKKKLLNENLDLMNLKGYDNKGTFKISYGERERVAIASLLVSQPNILIFDEPTTGQDYKHKQDFIKLAQKLNETHTLITISHDLEFLNAISNRVLLLENGKITETHINKNMEQNNSIQFPTKNVQLPITEN